MCNARWLSDPRLVLEKRPRAAKRVVLRRLLTLLAASAAVIVVATPARASQLIDRNATAVRIAVDSRGEALLTYDSAGATKHVLAWGAINALPPAAGATQWVKFKLDYSGGWGKYHTLYWQTFKDTCKPYTGPQLAWFVAGCTAPDGSYWAVQNFPQALPDLGFSPWTGPQHRRLGSSSPTGLARSPSSRWGRIGFTTGGSTSSSAS